MLVIFVILNLLSAGRIFLIPVQCRGISRGVVHYFRTFFSSFLIFTYVMHDFIESALISLSHVQTFVLR